MNKSWNDVEVITSGETVVGVCLGWDFTSEHESGIQKICDVFGINGKISRSATGDVVGVDVRSVTKIPKEFSYVSAPERGFCYLVYHPSSPTGDQKLLTQDLERLHRYMQADGEFSAAWCEYAFAVRMALNHPHASILQKLHKAFLEKDGVIVLGKSMPFANGGLNLIIKSLIPEEERNIVAAADIDCLNLLDAVEKTGIKQKLEAAGMGAFKGYYALSPRWKDDQKKEVSFWLNPCDQRNNNFGWVSVAQLEQWIEGKGPIPKKKEEVSV